MPVLEGRMPRRILLNYRVAPALLAPLLPAPLRPLTWRGWGVAGVCLIRLEGIRPLGLPAWMGLASENAAHRIAVAWEEEGRTRTGVFVLRRDTDATMQRLAGSRLFPGRFGQADFAVEATEARWDMKVEGPEVALDLAFARASSLPAESVFQDLHEASAFFQGGALGWSEGPRGVEGMTVELGGWNLQPLDICRARAAFFDDRDRFPEGSIALDSAFLMENLPLRWVDAGRFPFSMGVPCAC